MSNDTLNTIILGALLAVSVGLGLYITQKVQPEELQHLEQEAEAMGLRNAEVTDLLTAQAESKAHAEDAVRRWNSRYKVLPQNLNSPAVVAYLNELSRTGFRSFDITLGGVSRRSGYSIYSYSITGTAFFDALYDFIWEVENGRGLYRISDLSVTETSEEEPNPVTNVPRRHQLVQFSMRLEAYFGGSEMMNAPDSMMSVPEYVLPPRALDRNPFHPLILAQLPPNSDNLVDVEVDELISIVGDEAVFRTNTGPRSVRQGERVYLGRLTTVDARRARIVAELNKGGIRERFEVELATGERYRHAMGLGIQLIPLTSQRPDRPSPPQPGTPEYRRLFGAGLDTGDGPEAPAEPDTAATAPPAAERTANEPAVEEGRGVSVRPFPGMQAPRSENDD